MRLTDEQIAAIRDGTEGVTPGPWRTHLVDDTTIINPDRTVVATTCDSAETEREDGYNIEYERMECDAAHIARCDPGAIRAAMDELIESRAAIAAKDARIAELGALLDEDNLTDIITDSIDLDWTPRDAAKAIVRAMKGDAT